MASVLAFTVENTPDRAGSEFEPPGFTGRLQSQPVPRPLPPLAAFLPIQSTRPLPNRAL